MTVIIGDDLKLLDYVDLYNEYPYSKDVWNFVCEVVDTLSGKSIVEFNQYIDKSNVTIEDVFNRYGEGIILMPKHGYVYKTIGNQQYVQDCLNFDMISLSYCDMIITCIDTLTVEQYEGKADQFIKDKSVTYSSTLSSFKLGKEGSVFGCSDFCTSYWFGQFEE